MTCALETRSRAVFRLATPHTTLPTVPGTSERLPRRRGSLARHPFGVGCHTAGRGAGEWSGM